MENSKSYDIAIIFPDWYHYLQEITEQILEIHIIRNHCNFRNFVLNDFSHPPDFPSGYQPDGIIVSYDDSAYDAKWLKDTTVPVVNINSSNKHKHPSVGTCEKSMAKIIVDHFTTLNYEMISMIGTANQLNAEPLKKALQQECSNRNIDYWYEEIPDGIQVGEWKRLEDFAPTIKEKLLHPAKKTGIYAFHDMRGRVILEYCNNLKIKVPESIGILGRFNSINARLSTPELSSIVMPTKEIAQTAISLLINLIEKKTIDNLYPKINVNAIKARESTVSKKSPDLFILQARMMIREKACYGLTVDQIIQSLPVARSTFEKRYKAVTGVSPAHEIRDIRIKKARHLLIHTDLSVEEIGRIIGFTDPRPFVVFFKRIVQQTPGEFRNSHQRITK